MNANQIKNSNNNSKPPKPKIKWSSYLNLLHPPANEMECNEHSTRGEAIIKAKKVASSWTPVFSTGMGNIRTNTTGSSCSSSNRGSAPWTTYNVAAREADMLSFASAIVSDSIQTSPSQPTSQSSPSLPPTPTPSPPSQQQQQWDVPHQLEKRLKLDPLTPTSPPPPSWMKSHEDYQMQHYQERRHPDPSYPPTAQNSQRWSPRTPFQPQRPLVRQPFNQRNMSLPPPRR